MKRLAIAACVLLGAVALCVTASAVYAQSSSSTASSAPHKTSAKKKRKRHHREPKQMAPTPDRIKEVQDALARNGCYDGDPTGKWDASTVASMRKFQADHGLDGTGKIDALTLQKLGLGSEIAGAFAPRPVTAPTMRAAPSTSTPPATKPQPPKPSGGSAAMTQASPASVPAANPATPVPAAPGATPATSAAATTSSKPTSPPQPQ